MVKPKPLDTSHLLKPETLAPSSFTLPKLPKKDALPPILPSVQLAMAEIVEQADEVALEESSMAMESNQEDYIIDTKVYPIFNQENAKLALAEFADKQSPSLKTLIKLVDNEIEGNNLIVFLTPQQMEMTDKIKVEWQSFIRQYFNLNQLFLLIKESHEEITSRKAYTSKEQLDEMIAENPILLEFIQKFNLKLK